MNPEHNGKVKSKIPKKMSFWAKQGSARSSRGQGLAEDEGDDRIPVQGQLLWNRLLAQLGSNREH